MNRKDEKETKHSNLQAISIFATVLIALLGFFATYINSMLIEQRKANVAHVNEQLEKLYGPLLSLSSASAQAWMQFRQRHRPGGAFFDDRNPPSQDEVREWRRWMIHVFMPTNIKMKETITANSHLIEGSRMPHEFLELLAHVQTYQAVVSKWQPEDSGDRLTKAANNTAFINIPEGFDKYVQKSFDVLKRRQSQLLAQETVFGFIPSWMRAAFQSEAPGAPASI